MSYNISSNSLSNPLLLELLEKLIAFFQSIGIEFYIIGATARDMIISSIYNHAVQRNTSDMDIAIAIPDWTKFQNISEELANIEGFSKSKTQTQRFLYKGVYMLDIMPFGEIANADNTIYWPPEENQAMSVIGFTQVAKHTLQVEIDNKFTVRIASLPGIILLKLTAWRDRSMNTNKDADDIVFIISEYLEINLDRAVNENYDLYEDESFTTFKAGASLLGRDMKTILQNEKAILNEFVGILQAELEKNEFSLLINQMIETHPIYKYEEVYDALFSITYELKK